MKVHFLIAEHEQARRSQGEALLGFFFRLFLATPQLTIQKLHFLIEFTTQEKEKYITTSPSITPSSKSRPPHILLSLSLAIQLQRINELNALRSYSETGRTELLW